MRRYDRAIRSEGRIAGIRNNTVLVRNRGKPVTKISIHFWLLGRVLVEIARARGKRRSKTRKTKQPFLVIPAEIVYNKEEEETTKSYENGQQQIY